MQQPSQPQQSQLPPLLRQASATLGAGNLLRTIVQLPPGEDRNEWIAANIVDLHNQAVMLYSTVATAEICTPASCPRMMAGPDYEWSWTDGETGAPMACSAPDYIDYTLSWVQSELDNEAVFPSKIGQPFPGDFELVAGKIVRRLFRVYAHCYQQHFAELEGSPCRAVEHLNTSFKHFILFAKEFALLSTEDMEPLAELIQKIAPVEGLPEKEKWNRPGNEEEELAEEMNE